MWFCTGLHYLFFDSRQFVIDKKGETAFRQSPSLYLSKVLKLAEPHSLVAVWKNLQRKHKEILQGRLVYLRNSSGNEVKFAHAHCGCAHTYFLSQNGGFKQGSIEVLLSNITL